MLSAWTLLAVTAGAALAWMLALYLLQLYTRDAGIVDFGWTLGLGVTALTYGALAMGEPLHRLALLAVALPWSLRLAYYILSDRVLQNGEDARYATMRARSGRAAPWTFLLVFLVNALLIVAFGAIYLLIATHPGPASLPLLVVGVLWGWGAIAGEASADGQLARWKRDPANKGKTCRAGLWRYSRHPNYFFEWLHWFAYVWLAFGHPLWWLSLAGPAIMLVFLYRITGIPYTEQQSLRSRGDDYRAYQRETSAFVPWFPRTDRG